MTVKEVGWRVYIIVLAYWRNS